MSIDREPGPRSLLAMLGVYAGSIAAVVLASTIAGALERAPGAPRTREPVAAGPPDAAVLAFFGPLATGERFAGWTIAEIAGPRDGGLQLKIAGPAGQDVSVELRPLDADSPRSPAQSETLAIYVLDREMPAGGLDGVFALGRALRAREAAGARLPGVEALRFSR